MKILPTIVILHLMCVMLHAQKIEDRQFAEAIRYQCKTCIDDFNKLLPPAQEVTELNLNRWNIKNLDGIEGFINLMSLDCSYNPLPFLPLFTNPHLKQLRCVNTGLKIVPPLPSSVHILDISKNGLSKIYFLPDSLQELKASNNQLSELPPLQTRLTVLSISDNKFKILPKISDEITQLDCSNNLLDSLPKLSSSMQILDCSSNNISKLPALPYLLSELIASSNKIMELPVLPDFIKKVDVHENVIEKLPNLTKKLKVLNCAKNRLTEIIELPQSLTYLDCSLNSLTSLPHLPRGLTYLACDTNTIDCVTNKPEMLTTNGSINECIRGHFGTIGKENSEFLVTTSETQLVPYRKNDLWGFANAKGELMIPAQYESASLFEKTDSCTYSYAFVARNGKKGVVDIEGDFIVQPMYETIYPLQKIGFMARTDAQSDWTYISEDATIEENFPHWAEKDPVFRKYANVTTKVASINGGEAAYTQIEIPTFIFDSTKVGYLMKRKTPIKKAPFFIIETIDSIPPQYDTLNYLTPMSFDTLLARQNGQWGLISTKNKTLVNYQYDTIKPHVLNIKADTIFKKNSAYFIAQREGKWGVVSAIDTSVALNFEYDDVEIYHLPPRKIVDSTAMRLFFKVKKDGKWGIVGEQIWSLLLPIEYDKIELDETKNGFRLIKNNKEGYFVSAAKKTIPTRYLEVQYFKNGFAKVRTKDNKVGYVNENGLEYFD